VKPSGVIASEAKQSRKPSPLPLSREREKESFFSAASRLRVKPKWRHSRESGNPVLPKHQISKSLHRQKHTVFVFEKHLSWIPASAGMTGRREYFSSRLRVRYKKGRFETCPYGI
jgi:hypothetical protein